MQEHILKNNRLCQLFYGLVVLPVVLFWIGLRVRHLERLPRKGPAIIVANHNSHLDTLVLMSLFRLADLHRVRVVAAADYFYRYRPIAWFFENFVGTIPLDRLGEKKREVSERLRPVFQILEAGGIVIMFPEGTRGEPERLGAFKRGVSLVAAQNPTIPVYPVLLQGLGRSMPKGAWIPIPFYCDVIIGKPRFHQESGEQFLTDLVTSLIELAEQEGMPHWAADFAPPQET